MTDRRRPRSLHWLLVAQAVSLTGSRISFLAVPWLVLETTGSAARTGVVAFVEMLPYVLASALGGPIIDRRGSRRMSIRADVASVVVVALLPLLHHADLLPFAAFLVVIAFAGGLRGFGDTAKRAVFPLAVESSDVAMTRATALADGVDRLSYLLGGAIGGALIAGLGAANSLIVDAATFGFAAVAVSIGVRAIAPVGSAAPGDEPEPEPEPERYVAALRAGIGFVRRDPLVLGTALLVFATNLLDQAHLGLLVPVWVHDVAGSPGALGAIFVAFGLGAVAGNLVFTALAARLPRSATLRITFLLSGAPHILVMAVSSSVAVVCSVIFVSGVLCAAINPIFSAVLYERVPRHLQARVLGVLRALSWGGIPLGGLVGGLLVSGLGLRPALLVCGGVYLALTVVPLLGSRWRDLGPTAAEPESAPVPQPVVIA